jgi:hypothetical protein
MQNQKKVSIEDASELIKASQSKLKKNIIEELNYFYEDDIIVYSGNTELKKLAVGRDIVIVDGDLMVNESIEDCDECDASLLVVLGNLSCKNIITMSSILIAGNLDVENAILGDSLCDHILLVEGDIKATAILDFGHHIKAKKRITAKDIYSFNAIEDKNGRVKENLKVEDLADEIVISRGGERTASLGNTIDYIKKGGTIFRKPH